MKKLVLALAMEVLCAMLLYVLRRLERLCLLSSVLAISYPLLFLFLYIFKIFSSSKNDNSHRSACRHAHSSLSSYLLPSQIHHTLTHGARLTGKIGPICWFKPAILCGPLIRGNIGSVGIPHGRVEIRILGGDDINGDRGSSW